MSEKEKKFTGILSDAVDEEKRARRAKKEFESTIDEAQREAERIAKELADPKKYETFDVKTGEKVEGVEWILRDTGNRLHQLDTPGKWVGGANLGIYYDGPLHPQEKPLERNRDVIKSIALAHVLRKGLKDLTELYPLRKRSDVAWDLRKIQEEASKLASELEEADRDEETQAPSV